MVAINGIEAGLQVPATDATTNISAADVVGSKADSAVQAINTTASLAARLKGAMRALNGAGGIGTVDSAAAPANGVSLAAMLREVFDQADKSLTTATGVMANGNTTVFTNSGPIEVLFLGCFCVTANDGTASTLKYTAVPTLGSAVDVCAASASLASATAGTSGLVTGTFASALTVTAAGPVAAGTTKFIVPAGIIRATIATGPTTGTWFHALRYRPLGRGITVT